MTRKNKRGLVPLIAGAVLMAAALALMWTLPRLAQYVVTPPSGEGAVTAAVEAWDTKKEALREGAPFASLYCVQYGADISGGSARVFGVEGEFFRAHPLYVISGDLPTQTDMARGARVAAINESLAFRLFPGADAVGQKISLGDKEYTVCGVVRATAMPGDAEPGAVYAPLRALSADGVTGALLIADCYAPDASAARVLEESARDVLGGAGETVFVYKEILRQTMLLRIALVIAGFSLLLRALHALNARVGAEIARRAEELRDRYFRSMMGGVFGKGALFLLCYAALLAGCWGLMSLIVGPMTVFTEWVPDVFVDWSSISARATALIHAFARPISLRTREAVALELYGTALRWGMLLALLGLVLRRYPRDRA